MSRALKRVLVALLVLLAPLSARAQDVSFHGSVGERLEATLVKEGALVSTRDLPQIRSVSEANLQGRARLLEERLTLYVDVSGFYLAGAGYVDTDLSGRLTAVEDHDVLALRPRVVFSEAYLALEPLPHVRITAGKQRVVWGAGQHVSPTDLLNPLRDPTDPTFQREGALLALVDLPFERFTVSALVSPRVLYQQSGVPYAIFNYPGYAPAESVLAPQTFADPRDDEAHFAAALRLYALLMDTDINVWALYSNLYRDLFEDKLRFMASFSRTVFDVHEVHLEVLAQTGSARLYPQRECVGSQTELGRCLFANTAPLQATRLEDEDLLPHILAGTRSFLDDGSVLSLEYLYQADGYTSEELGDLLRLQALVGQLQREGALPTQRLASADGSLPQRFAFEPLRRHYVFLSYMQPRLFDDFLVQGTLISAVEDLSSIASLNVMWTAQEWMTLSLFGFFPLPSLSRVSSWIDGDPLAAIAEDADDDERDWLPIAPRVKGERYGEYDAVPFDARVMTELRLYF